MLIMRSLKLSFLRFKMNINKEELMCYLNPLKVEVLINGKSLCDGEIDSISEKLSDSFSDYNMEMIYSELGFQFSKEINIFFEFWVKASRSGELILKKKMDAKVIFN